VGESSFLRRALSGASFAAALAACSAGWDSCTEGVGVSVCEILCFEAVRGARFFGRLSSGCPAAACTISADLIDLDRPLGAWGRESVSAETVRAEVDFAAAFAPVLGEAPAAALRFLTGLSAGGAEGSPVKEKVGSVICDKKGTRKRRNRFVAAPRLLWSPRRAGLSGTGGQRDRSIGV
jgi:hypothetical protein